MSAPSLGSICYSYDMKLLAGVVQMTSRASRTDNLERAEALITEAAQRGATLIGLPENFALFTTDESARRENAEVLDGRGPIVSALAAVARKLGVALVLGGMTERAAEAGERAYNSCVYLGADGAIAAVYRKIHLFDVAIPDEATYAESSGTAPGTSAVVVDTAWAKLGLSVCYDVRFPELYRELAARGAQVLVVPAAFTQHTGRDHWHVLLRARAIENLCYVIAPAQFGANTDKRNTFGHALIVDPWGQVLAEVGDHEGVAVAELDLEYQAKLRKQMPALSHRRM